MRQRFSSWSVDKDACNKLWTLLSGCDLVEHAVSSYTESDRTLAECGGTRRTSRRRIKPSSSATSCELCGSSITTGSSPWDPRCSNVWMVWLWAMPQVHRSPLSTLTLRQNACMSPKTKQNELLLTWRVFQPQNAFKVCYTWMMHSSSPRYSAAHALVLSFKKHGQVTLKQKSRRLEVLLTSFTAELLLKTTAYSTTRSLSRCRSRTRSSAKAAASRRRSQNSNNSSRTASRRANNYKLLCVAKYRL